MSFLPSDEQGRETENIYQYDAFGNLTGQKEGFTNRILYTGHQKCLKPQNAALDEKPSNNIIADPARLLETTKNPQDHHIIPAFRGKSKPYADFICSLGIDVDQYTVTVSGGKGGAHMNFIHGKGKWIDFINNNHDATAIDVFQFAGQMMDEYGPSGLEIHLFRK